MRNGCIFIMQTAMLGRSVVLFHKKNSRICIFNFYDLNFFLGLLVFEQNRLYKNVRLTTTPPFLRLQVVVTLVELGCIARPVRSKKILHEYSVISVEVSRLPTHPSLAQTFEQVVCCAMP